ncbi:hypothetical protein HYY73_00260 [Candidatus Woesearchaeota archaeon]|nr:hypothetical protein [Candidatus Woesearchaeota archaeon]
MYLKKNVNFGLLMLVITVLVGTVAITTYFQSTYKEVSEDLEQKNEQLEVVSSNFTTKIKELNKTSSELQIKQMDKERLDQLYTDMLKAKELIDAELLATKGTLTETSKELERKKDELSDANYKLILQEDELTDLKAKVQNQLDTIRSRNAEIASLQKQLCDEKQALGKTC